MKILYSHDQICSYFMEIYGYESSLHTLPDEKQRLKDLLIAIGVAQDCSCDEFLRGGESCHLSQQTVKPDGMCALCREISSEVQDEIHGEDRGDPE